MAANNDYFVRFGSNAQTFARQLEADLAPARKTIANLQKAITDLESARGGGRGPYATPPAGGQTALGKVDVSNLQEAIYDQQRAMADLTQDLGRVVRGLQAANKAIESLPRAVANAKRGLTQLDNIDEGRGPHIIPGRAGFVSGDDPNAVRVGSALHRALQQIQNVDFRQIGTQQASIGSVSKELIDRAGVDRIVTAINKQTDVLRSGLPTRPGGATQTRTAVQSGEVEQEVQQVGQDATEALKRAFSTMDLGPIIEQATEAALNDLGGNIDDETRRAVRAQVAAEMRKLEREATGISRGEQSARAQEEFRNRPTITDVERDFRREQAALIASAGSDDFDSRLGRARTAAGGNYSVTDLRNMQAAFQRLGIAVDANTKASKEELAAALKRAAAQYDRDYPEGHPDLDTEGFNVQRTTQVSAALEDLIGDFRGAASEIQKAREAIRADRRSGGTGESATSREEQLPGTIGATKDFAGNWRGGFGAAIGEIEGLFSRAEVVAAEARVAADAQRQMANARSRIGDPDFDPRALSARSEIQRGSSDEDRALAEAAAGALRDLRLATDELDEFGRKAVRRSQDLNEAIRENQAFIERARARIDEGRERPDDRDRLAQAENEIRPRLARQAAELEPFLTAEYQAGLAKRDASRAAMESAREEMKARRLTTATWRELHQATGQAVLGVTSAPGARDTRRDIPGLGFAAAERGGDPRFVDLNEGGPGAVDPEQMERINQAARKLTAAQWNYLRTLQNADSTEAEKSEATERLEHAADTMARRIARNFNGIAPDVESLTGFKPTNPQVIADEADRQLARDRAALDARRKFEQAPEELERQRGQQLTRAQQQLADAVERRTLLQQRIAAQEDKISKIFGGNATRAAHTMGAWTELTETLETTERQLDQLKARRAIWQDPANLPGAIQQEGHARGPLMDVQGYERSLGYNPGFNEEIARLESEKARLEQERKQRFGGTGGTIGNLRDMVQNAEKADREIAELEAQLSDAQAAVQKKTTATRTETDALERVTTAGNGRIRELLEERRALRREGPYTRRDAKAAYAAGDADLEAQIRQRIAAIKNINRELDALGYTRGGGQGGGGGVPPTLGGAADAGDGNDRNILSQILATLRGIHATLKGGVKVTAAGGTGGSGGGTRATRGLNPTLQELNLSRGSDDEIRQAMELQRQRLERLNRSPNALNQAHEQALVENARRQRAQEEAAARAGRALREKARVEQTLAQATSATSEATKREIAELQRLGQAAVEAANDEQRLARVQAQIAAQQTRVASALNADLKGQNLYAADRRKLIGATLSNAGPAVNSVELDDIMRTISRGRAPDEAGKSVGRRVARGAQDGFAEVFGGNTSFWSRIMHTTGTFIVRNFAAGFVFGLTAAMQEVLSQALAAEATFVRVSDALESTNKQVGDLRGNLSRLSQEYGVALNDTYTTTAQLTGLFDTEADLTSAVRISTQLQTISNGALNADEAVGVLASTMSAFSLEGVEGATRIADVLTSIQNNLGVNVETTAEGIASIAGLANQLNITLEESGILVAAIAKQTNQTGAASGEQLSRILAAMQTGRGRGAIQDAFQDLAPGIIDDVTAGDYGSALTGIMQNWDNLTTSQQNNLAATLAGQRQMRAWQALMNDASKNMRALDKAQNSAGEASERMEEILKNLQSRIAQLSSTIQVFFDQLLQTGILNVVGVALMGITEALQLVNEVLIRINAIADSNPLLSWLRDVAGFAIGAAIAFKLLGVAVRGIRGAMIEEGIGRDRNRVVPPASGQPATVLSRGGVPLANQPQSRQSALRNGVILGGATALLRPQLDRFGRGLDGSNKLLGRWSSSFAPDGRFSRPIAEYGRRLANAGQQNLRALERARSQTAVPSMFDDPRGALEYAERNRGADLQGTGGALAAQAARLEKSSRSSQRALAGTSRAMTVFGRAAQYGAVAGNKLATAIRGISLAGVGADIALVAITLGLMRLAENAQRSGRLAEAASDSYDRLYGKEAKNRGGGDGSGGPAYIGPAREALDAELEQLRIDSQGWFGDVQDTVAIFARTFQDVFLGNPFNGIDVRGIEEYSDEKFGIDSETGLPSGQKQTLDLQNRLLGKGPDSLGALDTIEAVREAGESYASDLEEMAAEAQAAFQQGDINGVQYASWMAEIEEADEWIRQMIADRAAMMDNMAAGTALTADQVNKLLDTMSLIQGISQSGQSTIGADFGINFAEILQDQIDSIGLADDSRLQKRLEGLLGPYSNPDLAANLDAYGDQFQLSPDQLSQYAPPSAVDLAKAQSAVSAEAFKQAERELDSLRESNAPEEAIADAQAAKDRALQEYLASLTGLIDTIYSDADIESELQTAAGNLEGSIDTQVQAIQQVDRIFARQNRIFTRPLRAMRRAAARIQAQMNRLRNELQAAGQDPQQNQEYLDLEAVLGSTRADIRRLRGLLQGTAAWRQHAGRQIARVHAAIQTAIVKATADLNLQIARAETEELRAQLEAQKAAIISGMLAQFNQGIVPKGVNIPKGLIKRWGNLSVGQEEMNQARVDSINAQRNYDEAQAQAAEDAQQAQDDAKASAAERRQNAAALKQAQLGVRLAAAEARGDSVAAARVQVAMAKAMIAAARADLAAATTQSEAAQARIAILNAQAQLIGAHAAVQQAQADLVQSQYEVSIALAEAAGNTVLAASRQLAAARAALRAALKRSHGKATAEVNQARAEAIRAEAALRDARLQDDLDTIDFNLEMGRITQSAAIAALQEILRTRELTKEQRRQLLLQIKGMKEEMSDSQWNIGDIKLPTPYQMRRYIEERRNQFRDELNQAAGGNSPSTANNGPRREQPTSTSTTHVENTFHINGADTQKVKKIIEEVVGGGSSLNRTTGARRGR